MASMANLRALEESYKSKETLIYRGGQARSHLALRPASGLAKAGRNGAPMAHLREWVKLLLGGHDVGKFSVGITSPGGTRYRGRQARSHLALRPASGLAKGGRNGVDG